MKNYFLILAALCFALFGSCSKDDGITDDDKNKTEQNPDNGDDTEEPNVPEMPEISLDENAETKPVIEAEGGSSEVTFTAAADWKADIAFTRAEGWCAVNPASGSAGTVTVTITAEPNETFEERSATITILCGDTAITITVTQSGAEEPEGIPQDMEKAFPDPLFRAYVLENFDTDGDGIISEEEALAVTEIDIDASFTNWDRENEVLIDESKAVRSLNGIQYFKNLETLVCYCNLIENADLSYNTELAYLFCVYNPLNTLVLRGLSKLEYIDADYTQLTSLDVSGCTALTNLECQGNKLTTLDVGDCTALRILNCEENQLTTLDVSMNTELKDLSCNDNQLTSLDLSKNTQLRYLTCENNQIEELDLSKTDLVNSSYNKDMDYFHPLHCAPMETLKKVYLKKGWSIKWITEDWDRSSDYIPDHTEIIFVD